MPFPIQNARFANLLRRLFNVQGHLGLTSIEDVFPIVPLDSRDPSLVALRGEYRGTVFAAQGPIVGAFSRCVLGAAPSGGQLLTVEDVHVTAQAAAARLDVRIGIIPPLVAVGAVIARPHDDRIPFPAAGVANGTSGVNLLTANYELYAVAPDDTLHVETGYVLSGTSLLCVETNLVNVGLNVTFSIRTRTLTPQETSVG